MEHQQPDLETFKYVRFVGETDLESMNDVDLVLLGDEAMALLRTNSILAHDPDSDNGDFVITKRGFIDFLNDQGGLLLRQVEKLNERQREESLGMISESIRQLIMQVQFPSLLQTEISSAFARLQSIALERRTRTSREYHIKVNSSACEMDLPPEEIQLHVDVKTLDDLMLVIRRSYASLFSDHSVQYRRERSLQHDKCSIALIVQREETM